MNVKWNRIFFFAFQLEISFTFSLTGVIHFSSSSTMRVALLVFFAVLSVSQVWCSKVVPCSGWKLYKQCDSKWGSHRLGTSSKTICKAGCAMSSIAMSLYRYGERINNEEANPGFILLWLFWHKGNLNNWLTHHGGYASRDLIIWNSVHKLGRLHVISSSHQSAAQMKKHIQHCHPIIANVRHGGHWVLVNGKWEDLSYFRLWLHSSQ